MTSRAMNVCSSDNNKIIIIISPPCIIDKTHKIELSYINIHNLVYISFISRYVSLIILIIVHNFYFLPNIHFHTTDTYMCENFTYTYRVCENFTQICDNFLISVCKNFKHQT